MPTGSGFLKFQDADGDFALSMLGGGLLCPRFASSMEGLYSLVIQDYNRNHSEKEKDQLVSSKETEKKWCFRDQ